MVSHSTPRSDAQKQTYTSVMPATRSRMQAVRGRNTEPELRVRRTLHSMGYRFRLQQKDLPDSRHRSASASKDCVGSWLFLARTWWMQTRQNTHEQRRHMARQDSTQPRTG